MRFPLLLLVAFVVCLAGCDAQAVKREYMPLEKLALTEKFKGHEIVYGPVILRSVVEFDVENRDDWIPEWEHYQSKYEKMEGPFRLSAKVYHKVKRESEKPFRRCLYLNQPGEKVAEGEAGTKYLFLHEDSEGYGFKFIGVENEKREIGVLLLKSNGTIPEFFERNKEKIAREKERWDRMNQNNKKIPKASKRGGGKRRGKKADDKQKSDSKDNAEKAESTAKSDDSDK